MITVLLLHIIIALSSVAYTTYLFFAPSQTKFYVSYGLVALTIASGTYLVVSTSTPILKVCTTGLIYIAVVSIGIVAAHRRFARANIRPL